MSAAFVTATSLAQNNATFKFNNTPFTAGAEPGKTSFKSNEFIYAHDELEKTEKEYFNITDPDYPSKPHRFISKHSKRYTEADGKTYADIFTNGDCLAVTQEVCLTINNH